MSDPINEEKQIAQSVSTPKTIAEQFDIKIILQIPKSNGGNVSPVDCMIATGKGFAEVMDILAIWCDYGLLEIGNHQDSAIIYRLVREPVN